MATEEEIIAIKLFKDVINLNGFVMAKGLNESLRNEAKKELKTLLHKNIELQKQRDELLEFISKSPFYCVSDNMKAQELIKKYKS